MHAPNATIDGPGTRRPASYQMLLVFLLSLNFGIVFFDRNSLNFLMPFVQPELKLSDGQVGAVAGSSRSPGRWPPSGSAACPTWSETASCCW